MSIITYKTRGKHAKTYQETDHQEDHIEAETEAIEAQTRKQNSYQQEEEVMARAKYNRTESENRAIADKISELRMQGLPKTRATAAAFRMFRDGELTIKIDNIRQQPKKTAAQVAIEKAVMVAAERLRRKQEQRRKQQDIAQKIARDIINTATREGRPLTPAEQRRLDRIRNETE